MKLTVIGKTLWDWSNINWSWWTDIIIKRKETGFRKTLLFFQKKSMIIALKSFISILINIMDTLNFWFFMHNCEKYLSFIDSFKFKNIMYDYLIILLR